VAARTTGVGARGSLFVAAAVGVAASMQGGSVTRAGVATAALQGDCAGVAIGVVEDMAVGSAECLRRKIPKARNNRHYATNHTRIANTVNFRCCHTVASMRSTMCVGSLTLWMKE
jgi:hypothetical protein